MGKVGGAAGGDERASNVSERMFVRTNVRAN